MSDYLVIRLTPSSPVDGATFATYLEDLKIQVLPAYPPPGTPPQPLGKIVNIFLVGRASVPKPRGPRINTPSTTKKPPVVDISPPPTRAGVEEPPINHVELRPART